MSAARCDGTNMSRARRLEGSRSLSIYRRYRGSVNRPAERAYQSSHPLIRNYMFLLAPAAFRVVAPRCQYLEIARSQEAMREAA